MSANIINVLVKSTNTSNLPKPALPYRRDHALDRLGLFQPQEQLDLIALQVVFGERDALRTILRVRQKLRHALNVERWRGLNGKWWLYDVSRHMQLAYCLREETRLARRLAAVYFAGRRIAK
jgi:hypothetical protein